MKNTQKYFVEFTDGNVIIPTGSAVIAAIIAASYGGEGREVWEIGDESQVFYYEDGNVYNKYVVNNTEIRRIEYSL